MLDPQEFLKILNKNTVNFFVGVPDSLLKNFCSFIDLNVENKNHIIAANEGNAIAIGAGHYIASKKITFNSRKKKNLVLWKLFWLRFSRRWIKIINRISE